MRGSAVVIGAGIGGLSTAIALRDAGWSVRVLERWPQVVGLGAALGLWPQARQALASVGLAEAVERSSVPVGAAALYRADGTVLARMPANSSRLPDVRLISRRRLMDLLLERAAGIRIETGVSADEALLRRLLTGVDVVVGADGLSSGVRAAFLPGRTAPRYSGLIGYRGAVGVETGGYGETWGERMLFGLTPMEPGRTNFYAAVPGDERRPQTLVELRQRFRTWREPIPAVLELADEGGLLRNPICDLHPALPSYVTDRVALLGDAAHAMTPHLGRGACEALVDAASLVRQLQAASAVADGLQAYDRERRRASQRIAARSWRLSRIVHARHGAGLRNALLRAVSIAVR